MKFDDLKEDQQKGARNLFGVIQLLTRVENKINLDYCEILFAEIGNGPHQWDRFIDNDRDIVKWFNGMDIASKGELISTLLYSDDVYIKILRDNYWLR